MSFYTYILYSEAFDRYYIGQTISPDSRIIRHNNGYVKSTKPYRPWKMIWQKSHETRKEAMQLEMKLKSLKSRRYLLKWIEENPAE